MRISTNWLKEYIDTKLSVKEVADKLIMSGTEIETISKVELDPKVVVGEILKIEKHPNADRLQVAQTSIGKETLQIVCGATNIEVGQKVPVATLGAMIGDFEIKETELRGVKSEGMLCSESELELSDDHTGIMILDARAEVGKPVGDLLAGDTAVLDAEITPNRGDCLSMIGIARELSAVTGGKLKLPEIKVEETDEKTLDSISIEIKDKDLCERFMARVIKNVKIGPSPKWMQDRLSAVGVRPINNVVDVTNYVMFETGKPLHAFDLDKISGGKLTIRRAKKNEELKTLDGVLRKLGPNNLVVADKDRAISLAGVMGGANSEITDKTKNIVLESANFHPANIRKTAAKMALRSEASNRFEKGVPLQLSSEGLDRAAMILSEIADGDVLAGSVSAGKQKDAVKKVVLEFASIKHKLGVDISLEKAIKFLRNLGFEVSKKDKSSAEFIVPYYRLDVSIEEDLLEEVARMYGYDNIPTTLPEGVLPVYEENKQVALANKIRKIMSGMGFCESYSYSFTSKEKANLYRKKELVQVSNPLSQEQEYMRADLAGSLIDASLKNKEYGEVKLYEIAAVYYKEKAKIVEHAKLSGIVSLKSGDLAGCVIGTIRQLLNELNVGEIKVQDRDAKLPFSQIGGIIVNGKEAGIAAFVESGYTTKERKIAFFEIDMQVLEKAVRQAVFKPIPKFPGSERDLTFIVDKSVQAGNVEKEISNVASKIRANFEVADIYIGRNIPENKKAITVRFYYQLSGRTLTDKEVDEDQKKIINKINNSLGGEVRGEKQAE